MTARLRGCIVVDGGAVVAQKLTRPLMARGFGVALLTDEARDDGPISEAQSACRFSAKALVDAAFDRAVAAVGAPAVVVISMLPKALMQPAALVEHPADHWSEVLQTAMLSTLYTLQACHRVLKDKGGVIVMMGPAISLVGAAGYTALSTLLEAQRALAKSAARQWGQQRIRTHWITLGEAGNYADLDHGVFPVVPELGPPPPALARVPTLEHDVAPIVEFLSGEGAGALTGMTLVADGGNWMVP